MKKYLFIPILLIINLTYSQLPSYVSSNGLVGYWPFAGNANDISGISNNGSVNGATLTTDRNGNANSAYSFSGGSNISIPMTLALHNLPNRTFSCWFNANGNQSGGRIYETTYLNGGIAMNGNILDAWYYNGPNECNVSNVNTGNLNQWHNLVYVTTTNGLGSIYIDGVLINSRNGLPYTAPTNWLNNFMRFGIGAQGESYNGKIDDIGIWNRALTAQEIANLYNSCTPPASPTGTLTQTFCANPAPTVASLTATGTGIKWYAAATGGTALATTTPLVSGITYYASQTVSTCESTARLAVMVDFNDPQITASATTVCTGIPVMLTATSSAQNVNSCSGVSIFNFLDFTLITPIGTGNLIKNNNEFYLRSINDVLKSSNLTGPFTSLNFNSQIGISGAGQMLGFDNLNRLHISTNHNGLYLYDGLNWSSNGLIGFGTGGQYFTKLANGRLVISKGGFLRDIYYSDNNGNTWINATNIDVDWNNIVIASNGDLYASSGAGGVNTKGVIKSTDNGSSWLYLNSSLSIISSTGIYKDCNDHLFIVGDDKIFKSINNGATWNMIANIPTIFTSFPSYGQFVVASNGDFYYHGDSYLFFSNNQGITWSQITNIPGNFGTIREVDGNMVVCSSQGLYAKTINNNTSYLWSTGETTATINPTPTATSTYWCDVTVNGVTCRKEVTITVNSTTPAPTGTATQVFCVTPAPTVAQLTATGTGIQWYAAATGGTSLVSATVLVDGTTYYASQTVNSCESTTRLAVIVDFNDPQITASATTVCSGIAVTLSASTTATASDTTSTLPTNLQNSLVGYWPFNSNANDTSGNNNNGTVNGATLTTDRFGNANSAYYFSSTACSTRIDAQVNTASIQTGLTISIWILRIGNGCISPRILEFWPTSNPNGPGMAQWSWGNGINTIGIGSITSTGFDCSAGIPVSGDNIWYNIVYTNDGINGKFYKDGILITSIPSTGNPILAGNVAFGRMNHPAFDNFNGNLDDIGVWNRALTSQEIQQLNNSNQVTYLWSTGATTATINPTPTATTTYWCDVTVNGVTCRKEVTITVNSTTPAPTGTATQIFCVTPAPTVAQLTATGTGIQWYAAATGGTPLVSTTALVDGTIYYASQTVNGCESTTRFAVTVTLNDPQITASATTVCSGTPVNLTFPTQTNPFNIIDFSSKFNSNPSSFPGASDLTGMTTGNVTYNSVPFFISSWTNTLNSWNANYEPGSNPRKLIINVNNQTISELNLLANTFWGSPGPTSYASVELWNDTQMVYQKNLIGNIDIRDYIQNPYTNSINNISTTNAWNNGTKRIDNQKISLPSPLLINKIVVSDTGGDLFQRIFVLAITTKSVLYTTSYLWSTGETTATINPTPTATTTYWCDVTVNGVTCRKTVTITVNTTPTPTGTATQTFCATPAPTVASLTATGTGIQWYAAATGGSPLASTTALVDGTTYYASQTVNGCESTTRLVVTVDFNNPQITANATTVCSGTAVTLTASTTATPVANNCTLPSNLQNGLVGYWPFCGNANDASVNGNNGTVNGATLTTDRFGNANSAFNFDFINNNLIRVPHNPTLNLSPNYTISVWFNSNQAPPSANNYTFVSKHDNFLSCCGNNVPYLTAITWNANGSYQKPFLGYAINGNYSFIESNTLISINNWQHYVVVSNNNMVTMYLDGVQILNSNFPFSNGSPNTEDLLFGSTNRGPGLECMNGKLDDIAIYNRALSPAEIAQLYTSAPTYLWSTGATTASINPTPTATTTYWCDVTVNGVTCRKEITINVNSTTPAPTGTATQVFCVSPASIVASLTATGTGIQWYAAATGGSPLVSTTSLVDGTTYYASQTVNGCESTTRLAVLVDFNDPQITASATTVCSGTAVTLTASTPVTPVTNNCTLPTNLQNGLVGYWPFCGNANDASVNNNNGTVNGATLTTDRFGAANSAYSFDGVNDFISANSIGIPTNSNISISVWLKPNSNFGIAEFLSLGSSTNTTWGLISGDNYNGTPYLSMNYGRGCSGSGSTNLAIAPSLNNWQNLCYVSTGVGGICNIYLNGNFVGQSSNGSSGMCTSNNLYFGVDIFGPNYLNCSIDDISIYNRILSVSEISQLYNQPTYLWSTGATTVTINPSPTATTTYWCDVTVNGVTCRKEVTITVNSTTPAPTGTATQVFCITPAPTVASLTATGTGIQWYAVATGGTALASTTALVDGTTYYASQTVNGCESTTRLEITVDFNDPQITASATTVCSGTVVTLTASSPATPITNNCNLPTNLQNGLVGYWPFCGNANDASGNNNNGTINGATLTTDRFGNVNSAYSFDGNDVITTSINRVSMGDNMSISCFYKYQTNSVINYEAIIGGNDSNGTEIFIGKDLNTLNIGVQDGNYVGNFVSGSNAFDGNWHHIIYTYENQIGKIYLDGILSSTGNFTKCNDSELYNFGNEYEGTGYFFNGKIDDIGFWNRVLTSQEIQQLNNSNQVTYLWSTGETTATINPTPTATTTYWCDVTVNGVTCRKEVTITVNPNITPTFTQVADICSGATLTALPITSDNGITGTWSPALYNTATTTYTFTPTIGLCATTATMTITVNPNITPTFTQVAPICLGVTLAALPTTSDNSITGTWTPALDNTATTTYTFTPTIGLCATTATMTITVNPNITPAFTQVAPICSGTTLAALLTTSDNGITGTWSPALDNTATTTYTFTPTIGLCATTATMTITVNPLPVVPNGASMQNFCAIANPTISDLVLNSTNVYWFSSLTSTTPLLTSTLLTDATTYYAASYDVSTGCLSGTRFSVTVYLNNPESPDILTTQTFCEETRPTIASIQNTISNTIVYYDASVNGNVLLDTVELTNGMIIYASQIDPISGCEGEQRTVINIDLKKCELKIYNLITIDENLANNRFIIGNIENFPDNTVQIFNRYGALVWNTIEYDNTNNAFYGKARERNIINNSAYLPTGTYYYVIQYFNSYIKEEKEMKGFIHIDNKK